MLYIILTAITASIIFAVCNARNYCKRSNLRLSERPEPYLPEQPIPRSHYFAYYRDWVIAIIVLLVVAYGIYWIVNN